MIEIEFLVINKILIRINLFKKEKKIHLIIEKTL